MCSFMWRDKNHSQVPVQLLEETLNGLYEDGETKFIATRKGLLKYVVLPVNFLNGSLKCYVDKVLTNFYHLPTLC